VAATGTPPPDGAKVQTGATTGVVDELNKLGKVTLDNGVVVTFTASLREDGAPEVRYIAPPGTTVKSADVVKALTATPSIGNALGKKTKIVALADPDAQAKTEAHAKRIAAVKQSNYGKPVASLPAESVKQVQTALCMKPENVDGLWGKKTQATLLREREKREASGGSAAPDGLATDAELRALLAQTADQIAKSCKE
jgi:hypothetical protein